MTHDDFWAVVDRVHRQSLEDMQRKCQLLEVELRSLAAEEVVSFAEHFRACLRRSYTYDLWGAAFVMGDGCGDDGFMDFRSTLISLGRDIFERAMADPESLVDLDLKDGGDSMQWEGYQYVPDRVYQEMMSDELPLPIYLYQEPTGTRFEERAMSQRYPKLVAKHGYDESQW